MIKKNFLFIIIILFLPVLALSVSAEDSSTEDSKTGDIMVVAIGCGPPPYENGLQLTLNKMPDFKIPNWIKAIPDSLLVQQEWIRLICDSLGKDGGALLNYIYDSLGMRNNILTRAKFYNDLTFLTGITDSLGRYIFENVPLDTNQLVVENRYIHSEEKDISDSLYARRKDFPKLKSYSPELKEWFEKEFAKKRENNRNGLEHPYLLDCDPGAVDYIRVAPDSVSIVRISINIHDNVDIHIGEADKWNKNVRARGKEHENQKIE